MVALSEAGAGSEEEELESSGMEAGSSEEGVASL